MSQSLGLSPLSPLRPSWLVLPLPPPSQGAVRGRGQVPLWLSLLSGQNSSKASNSAWMEENQDLEDKSTGDAEGKSYLSFFYYHHR